MITRIEMGDIVAEVRQKDIKNVHLSVYPPDGAVRIAAPLHMNMESIRAFALTKLGWIKAEQRKMRSQERETPRLYLERESHFVWGRRYLLKIEEVNAPPGIDLSGDIMTMHVRPGVDDSGKRVVLENWYRREMFRALEEIRPDWEQKTGAVPDKVIIRKMKTKWGSYTAASRTIVLNLDLVRKPLDCLEYILVHELLHFIEPTHNARFISLMNRHLPDWRHRRELLNSLPLKHEIWEH